MTAEKRLAMIKSAMKALQEEDKLDSKLRRRGLKSLEQAYAKHTTKINCRNIYK